MMVEGHRRGLGMKTARFLVASILCITALEALSEEYSPEEHERLVVRNARHLCEWAKTNAPQGNPVQIRVCVMDGIVASNRAGEDTEAWWTYWFNADPQSYLNLREAWDAEKAKLDVQYLSERKAAEQNKVKAERERLLSSLPTMAVADICRVVRLGKTPEALEELVKRKTFPPDETALISGRRIRLGMSEGGMLCALGPPKRANRSVGTWGVHIQYVFDGINVYTENGKVTSWQD